MLKENKISFKAIRKQIGWDLTIKGEESEQEAFEDLIGTYWPYFATGFGIWPLGAVIINILRHLEGDLNYIGLSRIAMYIVLIVGPHVLERKRAFYLVLFSQLIQTMFALYLVWSIDFCVSTDAKNILTISSI